jgi:hypothetical protein
MGKPCLSVFLLVLSLSSFQSSPATAASGVKAPPEWPTIERQLARDHVVLGSALETLIYENQDFSMLHPGEIRDKIAIPLWLRVYWRKNHPEGIYSANDPTGGYPLVLKEVHQWMLSHQDLLPGFSKSGVEPFPGKATAGSNLRISGSQVDPRSESDIRINFFNPNQIIAAGNDIVASGGTQGIYYSSDAGATWGQTSLPLLTADNLQSDPAVDWTSDSTAWSVTIGVKASTLKIRAYKSSNGGATWTFDNTVSGTQKGTDKEIMWVDHSAASAFKDTIYVCWRFGNPAWVNRRTAAGWGTPIQVSGAESTGGAVGCSLHSNSAGDAFVFWPATGNSKIVMAKSTNGGASWGTPTVIATTNDSYNIGIPAFALRRALIYSSGASFKDATHNNVYVTWTDLSGETGCTTPANEPGTNAASTCKTRVWFARSTDGGSTWSAPVKVNNQASNNDQFNPWLAVDETTGNLGVMYYDTVNDPNRLKADVWFQISSDHGATWGAAVKVTTAMTDETVTGANTSDQYGDYNGLSGYAGRFFPSWTDRRNSGKEEIWTAPVNDP